jgi:putative transposase
MGTRSKTRKQSSVAASKRHKIRRDLRRPQQIELVHAYRGRGGPRPGAGRKPGIGRRRVPHRRRAPVRRDRPLHITLRLLDGLPPLRRARAFDRLRSSIGSGHKSDFRVIHYSILDNHLHLVAEADDRGALSRGVKGLKTRMTKALNKLWGRKGTVFADRYHDREIATPRQARSVLLYVICNYRKHFAEAGRRLEARWVDPFSSARQLDGWNQRVRLEPGVVAAPRTWLLKAGWKRHGLLDAHAIPAAAPP